MKGDFQIERNSLSITTVDSVVSNTSTSIFSLRNRVNHYLCVFDLQLCNECQAYKSDPVTGEQYCFLSKSNAWQIANRTTTLVANVEGKATTKLDDMPLTPSLIERVW